MKLDITTLNPEQREAVTTTRGPLLVLAGAGSGKTRVITTRIAYLVAHEGVPSERILAVTFTNKAAREMVERVKALLKGRRIPPAKRPTICTFHSLGVRLLRAHIEKLGYRPGFVIYDTQDQQAVVRTLIEEGNYEEALISHKDAHFALQVAKSKGQTAAELSSHRDAPRDLFLGKLMAEYQDTLKRMNAIDFEDILQLSLQLCREHPAATEQFFSRYSHVMVDEYQDTNRAQYDMLRHAIRPHGNLCVVGDDDQSIYGWRGAEPGNILDFERDFPGARVVRLERNYRSTGTILSAANQVIGNNTQRKEKTLRSTRGPGKLLLWLEASCEMDEMEKVLTHMRLAHMRENSPWGDFAILFRSNFQSRQVEEALRDDGIPYKVVGGTRFYERKEVKDALAYLRLMVDPFDEVSLQRVMNFPRRGIGKSTQASLMEYAAHQGRPPFRVMEEASKFAEFSPASATAMERFTSLIRRYARRFEAEPLGVVFRELMGELEFHRAVEKEKADSKTKDRAVSLIHELEFAIDQFTARGSDEDGGPELKTYLEHVTLMSLPEDDEQQGAPMVTLLTVHSAKGLEFPRVYLVGLADGVFPHKRSLAEGGEPEERRLFYVALTRARNELVLSMAKTRKRWGKEEKQEPSRFLLEIDRELFDGEAPAGQGKMTAAQKARKVADARERFFNQIRKARDTAGA
ncbi:MAG: UvrD-helicase domain-containing protein [Deltaproteobacteria bacterium]|nr:UvrD-helicase domain-containing protein [Deltaproteobacteria bacterium]